MSDSKCYAELSSLFAAREATELYDFEVVPDQLEYLVGSPSGIAVFREEHPAVVIITKTALVRAYIEARKVFFDDAPPDNDNDDDEQYTRKATKLDPQPFVTNRHLHDDRRLLATEVMLLFDPEHLTACNFRKRKILEKRDHFILSNTGPDGNKDNMFLKESEYLDILQNELALSTTYLRSPLYPHAKSNTLWYHRVWLLRLFMQTYQWYLGMQTLVYMASHQVNHEHVSLQKSLSASLDYILDFCHSEASNVLSASEKHHKNYCAFNALRVFFEDLDIALQRRYPHLEAKTRARIRSLIASDISLEVFEWCTQYPSDTSGWSYLFHSLSQFVDDEQQRRHVIIDRAINFAARIGRKGTSFQQFIAMAKKKWPCSTSKQPVETRDT